MLQFEKVWTGCRSQIGRALLSSCLLVILPASLVAQRSADEVVDFNDDVRPILQERCFRCHGPDAATREAGLRLDQREGALAELESGLRAIVPADLNNSELLSRISSLDEDLRMPPEGSGESLADSEIAILRQWIEQGASYQQHWAFVAPQVHRPVTKSGRPAWGNNAIDRFVFDGLRERGLVPAERADRYTLVRRLSLDLTGLPPTIEEVDHFVFDQQPDAYARLVDRLLQSPAFGERWARVWLDIARYADSAGYAADPPRVIWRYRDWVIDALNRNLPFDEFSVQQLAGDLLPNSTDEQLLATAFHRNTMTNSEGGTDDEEFRSAAVVDRVNTTMQVWMGLTMGCAQCHSHKYDPISQEEYFQFYAVFNNTADADRADESPGLREYTAEENRLRKTLQSEITGLKTKLEQLQQEQIDRQATTPDSLQARFVRIESLQDKAFLSLAEVQVLVGDRNVATSGTAQQSSVAYDGPAKFAIDGETNGDFNLKSTTHTAAEDRPWWEVDLKVGHMVDAIAVWNRTDGDSSKRLKQFRVVALNEDRQAIFVKVFDQIPMPSVRVELPQQVELLSAKQLEAIAQYRQANQGELSVLRAEIATREKQLQGIKGVLTPIMRELPRDKRRTTHVQIRGNFLIQGAKVEAGVPASFHPLPADVEPNRLEVTRWLVSADNPLTARVAVNRCWEQLFGIGLVETSEDFGTQGELPSHPRLLDTLAVRYVDRGWDTKWLLREIVMSATYQQASGVTEQKLAIDPSNRLLSRGASFRLSAEMIRDQALAIAGQLSRKMMGPSVRPPRPALGLRAAFGGSTDWQPSAGEDRFRRGIYTRWRRTTPYPSMTTFDAPSREVCTIRRVRTNTPLQALVTLNDPVFIEAAKGLASRMVSEPDRSVEDRIAHGFRLCVARPPARLEVARLAELYGRVRNQYAQQPENAKHLAFEPLGPIGMTTPDLAAWTVLANVLLNLDELLAKK
ncbi:MAG: DUF1553 domain-containing protein [Pirellulaceae bacterium]|nr:DUF1553 domain-containing protein [Pirellulaceae bacterium]